MAYLSIEDIEVSNANAWNGIMIGVPAITAFMGAVHALQRKLTNWNCMFTGTAIGIKEYAMREYETSPDKHHLIIPLPSETTDKFGNKVNARIFIQAYIDLKLHLIIKGDFDELVTSRKFLADVQKKFNTMRIAGGNIGKFKVKWINEKKLPTGFYLKDCTKEMMAYDGENVLEKMINALEDKTHKYVVLANGFRALTEPYHVKNQRDPNALHCFAEQVYTCGEYVSVNKIDDINDYFFRYKYDGVSYLCVQI